MLFIYEAAAVLIAAYKHVVRPLYRIARLVTSPSRSLNGVGKGMIAELHAVVRELFDPRHEAQCISKAFGDAVGNLEAMCRMVDGACSSVH